MPRQLNIKLDADTKRFIKEAKRKFSKDVLYGELLKFFSSQGQIIAGQVIKDFASGQRLDRRTGALARSIAGTSARFKGVPAVRVGIFRGPSLKYAGVQEFGTKGKNPDSPFPTIRPKSAKALAMPLRGGGALTPAGVDRFGGPRKYPGELKFIPFRKSGVAVGALYDADKLERAQKASGFSLRDVTPAYLLLTKVDIEPKNFLRDGMLQYLPKLTDAMGAFMSSYMTGK